MQIHHIEPAADGGSGDFENGLPVCLDCHAEIESKSNMGRRFTPAELRGNIGPLEALLAELEFNRIVVSDGTPDDDFPVLAAEHAGQSQPTRSQR
jgi:hypothetical protein